jgi:hypothetical protein
LIASASIGWGDLPPSLRGGGYIDEVIQAIMSLAFSHVLYDKDALAASNV